VSGGGVAGGSYRFRVRPGEPAELLGWGGNLDVDELAILRALADAGESLQARGIARALGQDEDSSTLRIRLSPKGQLRAGGYITHETQEGYSLTEKGRTALDSAEV
jgi:repressor of nif and glnA expression